MLRSKPEHAQRPWEQQFGWAKDDPIYDEAMRLGAEYRSGGLVKIDRFNF
jgi:hypothetical protein